MLVRRVVATLLVAFATLWAVAIVGLPRAHVDEHPSLARVSAIVWMASSVICHQRPERSFHAAAVQYPVCARCTGLYLAAPFGLLVAFGLSPGSYRRWRSIVLFAAVPTAMSILLEQLGGPTGLTSRMVAALPLGAALAGFVGAATMGRLIHY